MIFFIKNPTYLRELYRRQQFFTRAQTCRRVRPGKRVNRAPLLSNSHQPFRDPTIFGRKNGEKKLEKRGVFVFVYVVRTCVPGMHVVMFCPKCCGVHVLCLFRLFFRRDCCPKIVEFTCFAHALYRNWYTTIQTSNCALQDKKNGFRYD